MGSIFDRIADARTVPEISRLMLRYFRACGFRGVSYFAYRAGDTVFQRPMVQAFSRGFSAAAVDVYMAADFANLDVVPRITLATGRPGRWREIWARANASPEEQQFLDRMRAVDLGDGVSLPCYGPQSRNAVVGIGNMRADAQFDDHAIGIMHMAAHAAHLKVCALTTAPELPGRGLSAREREILDLVARGKSNSVIAELLNISVGTVDTYLRRVYEKLGVGDRTSAVVRGIGLGLIAA